MRCRNFVKPLGA